ncbi:long-chain acyl-CoA synthetase [Desulfitispora alkaliphila]|uniref:long-chain-fatty-acid--CoA ligase n=1 Tax=Desulfitispora alkaliphila TaxID=622674 RepID=UPI003D1DF9B4
MTRAWEKSYPKNIGTEVQIPNIPLYQLLDDCVEKYASNAATEFFGAKLSYSELNNQVNKMASALEALGVKKGSRVSVMLPNCPQYVISYYATLKLGASIVQTNPLYVEKELEFQLNDAEADTIIALDLLYKRVENVIGTTPLKNIIFTSISDYLPFPLNFLYKIKQWKEGTSVKIPEDKYYSFKKLIAENPPRDKAETIDPVNDVAVIQYTGGTTGKAKGVMLTHKNLVANVYQVCHWMPDVTFGEDDILAVVPFFHVYGMTVAMNLNFRVGGKLIMVPKFEVADVLKIINKAKPAIFPGAPTMYIGIVNHPDITKYDLTSIKVCISGSAPLPIEIEQRFEEVTKGNLVEGYGLSEASPVTHCTPLYGLRKPGIGLPLPNTDAKIVDLDTGEDLEVGDIGELLVKGPQVMKGYLNRKEETANVLKDGWLKTGDIASIDEDGFFTIVDRKKDMIIAGGFNIYPRDVEEVLFEHPKVLEAAVIGVPHEYRGETVKAFIVLKEDETATAEEIKEFCKQKMAKYKVPTIIEFRSELPKTMIGKVLRRALQEENKDTG